MFVGAAAWGVAGMILFLPFAAMLNNVCEEYEELKPIALLIGNKNYQDNESGNKWLKKIKSWFSKFKTSSRKKKQQESSGLEV